MTVLRNRTGNTTTTIGTGPYTVGAAIDGLRSILDAFAEGETGSFVVEDGTDWEIVIGRRVGDTVTRDQVEDSSNSGAAVDWGPGTRNIVCTSSAKRMAIMAAAPSAGDGGRLLALDADGHLVPLRRALVANVAGTADALVLTTNPAVTTLSDGDVVRMVATGANTGPVTAALNGGTALALRKETSAGLVALAAGDIRAGNEISLVKSGAVLLLSDPQAVAPDLTPYAARSANLSDLTDKAAARTNLGVYGKAEVDGLVGAMGGGQLALTNLRLLLATSVSSGALAQGYQWELGTDEWSAGSSNAVFMTEALNYYANAGGSAASYSNAGGSGNRAAIITATTSGISWGSGQPGGPGLINGSINDSNWCAGGAATGHWFLFNFATPQFFEAIKFYGAWDSTLASGHSAVLKAQGSNDGSSFTDIGTEDPGQTGVRTYKTYTLSPAYLSTSYKYIRLYVVSGNWDPNARHLNEVEFKLTAALPFAANGTLMSPPVPVTAEPSAMSAYFLWHDDSGTAVLGTDLTVDLSRDGGTTWTSATLTTAAAYDGTYSVVKARSDVSGQPSGTSMKARIRTLNAKAQRVAAPALYKE